VPIEKHSPATVAWLNALVKYSHGAFKAGTIPDFGVFGGWVSLDTMIYGLEHAGKNPTRASFEQALDRTSGYTANGLLATPSSWTHFGTAPSYTCAYNEQLVGKKFIPTEDCGHLLPNSNQA